MTTEVSAGPPAFDPVKTKCRHTKCDDDMHALSPDRRKKNWRGTYHGQCLSCGATPVDFGKMHRRDRSDFDGIFDALGKEYIRRAYLEGPFDEKAIERARKRGMEAIKARVRPMLRRRIGAEHIFRDGIQTPSDGDVLNYAQHATATCCRKCLDYWYGIEQGRELEVAELDFCEALVHAYLDRRAGDILPPATPRTD